MLFQAFAETFAVFEIVFSIQGQTVPRQRTSPKSRRFGQHMPRALKKNPFIFELELGHSLKDFQQGYQSKAPIYLLTTTYLVTHFPSGCFRRTNSNGPALYFYTAVSRRPRFVCGSRDGRIGSPLDRTAIIVLCTSAGGVLMTLDLAPFRQPPPNATPPLTGEPMASLFSALFWVWCGKTPVGPRYF